MNKIDLYHKLPLPFRTLAASLWGYYLRWLRYGPDTEQWVSETLGRESWSMARWKTFREERLANILDLAATTVPYYREYWRNRRKGGDMVSWEQLENWPILEKAKVRENPKQFISDRAKPKFLHVEHTSGTTGTPTLIYLSRDVLQKWFAIFEARTKRWFELNYLDRWGIFGGQKIISLKKKEPPYWVYNSGLNQVYFSIFHINQQTTKDYVEALWHYKPNYLVVYPSSLAVLSRYILESNLEVPSLQIIFCNAESVTDNYRKVIELVFNCPVIETYGMVELLSAYSQCSEGTRHFWPEIGIVEIYDTQKKRFLSGDNTFGQLCFTTLLNEDMPLIRYINGDMGSLPDWETRCSCGRSLPIMSSIHGRSKDLIMTQNGRELYFLDSFFSGLPIVEAQLVQEAMGTFTVKAVPINKGYEHFMVEGEIKRRLRMYLGEVDISLTRVDKIERNANGKFKPFVSKINPSERNN